MDFLIIIITMPPLLQQENKMMALSPYLQLNNRHGSIGMQNQVGIESYTALGCRLRNNRIIAYISQKIRNDYVVWRISVDTIP